MTFSLIVPWDSRNIDRYRANSFNYVLDWWNRNFPSHETIVSVNTDSPFNLSKSRNDGLKKAQYDKLLL